VADDLTTLENFAYGDTPTRRAVQGLVSEVLGHEGEFDISEYDLSRGHDVRPLVVKTLLTYLELDGYVESGTPFYARYQFKPLVSSAEILSRFEGERRDFLAAVFRCAKQAKIWFSLDLHEAAVATASPRDRIVRALDYLAEQQLLEVKVEGVRQRFRRLKPAANLASLSETLWRKSIDREVREIARLKQIWELAGHAGCQVSSLGAHFGEPLAEPCGHCSWCLNGQQPLTLAGRPAAEGLDEATLRAGRELARTTGAPLDEPRSLARLLCGLTSPQLSARKLTSHKLFGSLASAPFPAVLAALESKAEK
jgi:ATP-dependent DNA helicase RecQ